MERFLSAPLPLAPSIREGRFSAADLIFYDVSHANRSYEALVFLNAPEVDAGTPREPEAGFAGSFVIFGHGGCFGDEGHCQVPSFHKDPFDSRPLHPLTPQTKMVDVGEALRRVAPESERLLVSVLAVVPAAERPELEDLLFFSSMRFVAYD
jgi:tyrosinase